MADKNKLLKIGMLSFYYPHLGGSGIVATRMAKQLAKKGHEIHFIGYETDENPKEMEDFGVQLHRVRKINYPTLKNEPYVWTLASRLSDLHKEIGLDVVHAHYALPHALSAFIAREQLKLEGIRLPYVVTGHGSDIHTNGSKEDVNPILRLCLNQADALTFVSKDLQRIARENLGITRKSEIIPNFVDTKVFFKRPTDLRPRLEIPESAFVIGHTSNFAPIKQVYKFGYLAEHLKSDGVLDHVYFLMVGEGRDRSFLEERMKKIDAENNVRFLGKLNQKELSEAYNAMDVFILPSKHEGNPLVLLEAMATQIPVIGANVGGIRETIGNEGGFLFSDNGELFKGIYSLKNNPELRYYIGRQGLEKVKRNHSIKGIVGKYLQTYLNLTKMKNEA